ncbi:hypothetical protein SCOR_10045 [Sulfidibacter corallicola]|uniref:Tetratricopeptide repeat protein n=1 Tax=Sulfidibacter corallicola TaxID=2818388 RepID=A0A8A4TWK6_SULCO|nr:tetratricopeptide repeat protein [Sulfidibacter corallicola]QTD50905.1 hypothetical protein J3U87_00420 [Sulfidibacter corallicola]
MSLDEARIYQPIDRIPYLKTPKDQKLYLGIQYKWAARANMGKPQPVEASAVAGILGEKEYRRFHLEIWLKELQEQRSNSLEKNQVIEDATEFGSALGDGPMELDRSPEPSDSVPIKESLRFNHTLEVSGGFSSSMTENETEENGLFDSIEEVPDRETPSFRVGNFHRSHSHTEVGTQPESKAWKNFIRRKSGIPSMAIAKTRLFIYGVIFSILAGAAFAGATALFSTNRPIEALVENWEKKGPEGIKDFISKKENDLTKAAAISWNAAYDREVQIKKVKSLTQPLIESTSKGWRAKGFYTLGAAHLYRGNPGLALDQFDEAIFLLERLPGQRRDLKRAYLYRAECYIYLEDTEEALREFSLAENVGDKKYDNVSKYLKAICVFNNGDVKRAIDLADESLKTSLLDGNEYHAAFASSYLCLFHTANRELDKAYKYLKLSKEISQEFDDPFLDQLNIFFEYFWAERMDLPLEFFERQLFKTKSSVSLENQKVFIEVMQRY